MNGDDGKRGAAPFAEAPEEGRYYGCALPPDSGLTAEGWEWRCNADPRRARELVDTYAELGFETRLEPVDAEALCAACGGCKEAFAEFSAVYVRKTPRR